MYPFLFVCLTAEKRVSGEIFGDRIALFVESKHENDLNVVNFSQGGSCKRGVSGHKEDVLTSPLPLSAKVKMNSIAAGRV